MAKPRRPARRPSREQGEITPGVREEARHRVFMGRWAKAIIELGTLRTVEVKALLEQGRRELGITEDSLDPYPGLPWEHAIKLDALRRPMSWSCSRCRLDAPAVTQTVRQFIDPISIEYARQTRAADTEINRTVTRTEDIADTHNERAVKTQVRSTVAADASIPDLAAAFLINKEQGISNATKNTFIKRNIALIKIDGGGGVLPIPREHVKRMTRILDLGIRRNTSHVSIARELRELNGITARRSRTIAIDQINKHNSAMSRTRHNQMGFDFYFWHNQGDGKVRPEHEERQGIEFAYARPPPDGNPGEPVR